MANPEHLAILNKGVEVWNQWRKDNPDIRPDISRASLFRADLNGIQFSEANLFGAHIYEADLRRADLSMTHLHEANLIGAVLRGANLRRADLRLAYLRSADLRMVDLSWANLFAADLRSADLRLANLSSADLRRVNLHLADLSGTSMGQTALNNIDLSHVKGLDKVEHRGPSSIGIDTIYKSAGSIPEGFLRGVGVPDQVITYMNSIVGTPIEYYSAFISHSSEDKDFADRLFADLQNNNVRTWYAPEELKIGDKFRQRIDESIRLHDKLLLVLSEHSVLSDWVEFEVESALDKGVNVLFPVRIDDAVMESDKAWAKHIKRTLHIGDFTNWKEHDAYQAALERLLRDLKAADKGD